ncbi:AAA family ATPase [Thermobifida halotolerans]|uniref:AAA family ATPase n=1 Tax=Thermobifida halotolerans TaxID=483545 RepID=A0A399FUG0_9ACTN|nr:AAA family ATPase [Thermobifida halotolerans]UOE19019.1 AAA family ATPase [Thermobifida halotolerans]
MRLAVVGAYGAGKTTLISEFAKSSRLPAVHGSPMRDPAGVRPKSLEEVTPAELVQLVVRRFTERAVEEALHFSGFVSDGSLLHEWVYATVRLAVGLHPAPGTALGAPSAEVLPYAEIVEALGREVRRRAFATYDVFVHLPVEFPLTDPVKPISEHFRVLSDRLLLEELRTAGVTVHTVTGPVEERLSALARLVDR